MRYDGIETCIKIVKEIDNLKGSTDCRELSKTYNITEIYSNTVETFRFNRVTTLQSFCDGSKNRQQDYYNRKLISIILRQHSV